MSISERICLIDLINSKLDATKKAIDEASTQAKGNK